MRFGKLILGAVLLIWCCLASTVWAKNYSLFALDFDDNWAELSPESKNSAGYNVVSLFNDTLQTMLVVYSRDEKTPLSNQELKELASEIVADLRQQGFMLTKHWSKQGFFICKGRLNGIPMQFRLYQIETVVFMAMVVGKDIKAGSELAGEIEAFY